MRAFVSSNNIAYITLFCVIFCFEWSTQDKLHLHIPAAEVQQLRNQAEVCSKETGVPAANLRKIIDKTLGSERPNQEFFQCVVFNTGFVDKDGHFIAAKLLTLEIKAGTQEDITNIVVECNKISLGDNIETAYAAADCVHNAIHFSV